MSYLAQIEVIHRELGVPIGYVQACGIALQRECQELVETELDVFGRQPYLEAAALLAWEKMKAAALAANVELQIISAFRSVNYQKQLLLNKMAKGQKIAQILKVNAAPGYSEHHSGEALDIGSPGYEHLSEEFEKSSAFEWLSNNAKEFGYKLSFPKGNPSGILYEPWHWKFSENKN